MSAPILPQPLLKPVMSVLSGEFLTIGIFRPKLTFFLFGLGDAPGSPSKLYVTLLLCSFFVSFCILSTSSPPCFFLPHGPEAKHKASHIFAACRHRRHTAEIQRYLFILLSQTEKKKKSKEDCVYKRQRKIKEHFSSCEDDGLFCLSSVVLLLPLVLLSPQLFSPWTISHNLK